LVSYFVENGLLGDKGRSRKPCHYLGKVRVAGVVGEYEKWKKDL
jgi:hypothetical protein